MAWDDLVRVKLENGAITSVGRAFAEQHAEEGALEILTDSKGNEMPGSVLGRTPEPEYPVSDFAVSLRGAELNTALDSAGLSKTGSLADKQGRLAEFRAAQAGAGVPADADSE